VIDPVVTPFLLQVRTAARRMPLLRQLKRRQGRQQLQQACCLRVPQAAALRTQRLRASGG
jgi:hypothetical protein